VWPREVTDLAARLSSLPDGARIRAVGVCAGVLDLIDARVAEVEAAFEDPALADQIQRLVRLLDTLPLARRAYWERTIQAEANAAPHAASPPG
jgi:hypothetical protein